MSTEELAKQLHDKATRGNMLSAAEQAQLEAWYAQQDQEEKAILERATPPQTLAALQTQVETAVAQLLTITQRVQELVTQNEALRREIATLQHQLVQTPTVQLA